MEGRRGELDERPEYLALWSLASPAPGRRPPQLFPYRVGLPPVAGAEQLFAVAKQPGVRERGQWNRHRRKQAGRQMFEKTVPARIALGMRCTSGPVPIGRKRDPRRGVSSRFRNPGPGVHAGLATGG